MNIPITTAATPLNDFVFRSADRMRIDGCTNAIAREGLSLALQCEHEALIDHYLGLLLARLRQQAPEHSIEVYFPTNADALLARFNDALARQSLAQATQTPEASSQAQIWVVHDAQALPETEIQLLARLIQNFPGANIRAILLMTGERGSHHSLASFGRKILRWEIEAPNAEQSQAALELARAEGRITPVQQLIRRIQTRQWSEAASSSVITPDDFATSAPIKQSVASPKSPKSEALSRMDGFYQHGLRAIQSTRQALGQLNRKHLRMALALAAIFSAAALVMLWIQPEAFGIGQSKAMHNTKATVTAPTRPEPASDLAPTANPSDKPAPSTSGSPTPSASR
ncbi:hypothetical protein [Limnohabitans sp. Rim8]|uniref:hypothetical protein n=1 Tax=Limnohabitans sp. Rim8 TaxID=1100718 RepID=UPI002636D35A|nr:hypothetical protein [Limnohabitans sp. Rim8]